jgi:hypothetical protein
METPIVPQPAEAAVLERIATALERIAAALEPISEANMKGQVSLFDLLTDVSTVKDDLHDISASLADISTRIGGDEGPEEPTISALLADMTRHLHTR